MQSNCLQLAEQPGQADMTTSPDATLRKTVHKWQDTAVQTRTRNRSDQGSICLTGYRRCGYLRHMAWVISPVATTLDPQFIALAVLGSLVDCWPERESRPRARHVVAAKTASMDSGRILLQAESSQDTAPFFGFIGAASALVFSCTYPAEWFREFQCLICFYHESTMYKQSVHVAQ